MTTSAWGKCGGLSLVLSQSLGFLVLAVERTEKHAGTGADHGAFATVMTARVVADDSAGDGSGSTTLKGTRRGRGCGRLRRGAARECGGKRRDRDDLDVFHVTVLMGENAPLTKGRP